MTDLPVPPNLPSPNGDPADHSASPVSPTPRSLIEEVRIPVSAEEPSFSIALDESADTFVATKDGVEFGGVVFTEKADRVLLLATSILPEFRGQGLAAALTRRVLDQLHAEGKSVTVVCPVFRSFIQEHPKYAARLEHGPGENRSTNA